MAVLAAAVLSGTGTIASATSATSAPPATGLAGALAEVSALAPGADPRVVVVTADSSGRPAVAVLDTGGLADARHVLVREASRPQVVSVELDTRVHAFAAPDPLRPQQWNVRALAAPALWAAPQARTVTVAVIDSGVDRSHPDLRGAVVAGQDLVGGGDGGTDLNGHGTHVAGIVAAQVGNGGVVGLAPRARVLPITVLAADGSGYSSDVARGIVRAVDLGADVLNLSLGSSTSSAAIEQAVAYALDHGAVVVAAAGNDRLRGDPVLYPAALPGVLAVGSTSEYDLPAATSSTGAHVRLAAPGEDVLSTVPGGWQRASGTSMAAPHVSAAAALLLGARSDVGADEVSEALVATARDVGAPGRDDRTGAGLVQPVAALARLGIGVTARATAPVGTPVRRDLDADGRPDLLTVNGSRLLRYEGSGNGGFASRTVVGTGWSAMDAVVVVGDWNGDGRTDLLARTRADARLLLYAGSGTGSFGTARQVGNGWGGFDALVGPGDVDGDGVADLVARRRSDGALLLYPGTGRGGMRAPRVLATSSPGLSGLVVLGDWDNDGAPDLAQRDGSGRLVMHPGDGVGGTARPVPIGTGWGAVGVTGALDWDGDRRPDLLAVTADGTLRSYPSNGIGGFGRPRAIGNGWTGSSFTG